MHVVSDLCVGMAHALMTFSSAHDQLQGALPQDHLSSVERQQSERGVHEDAGVEHHGVLPIKQRRAPHKEPRRSLAGPQHRPRRKRQAGS